MVLAVIVFRGVAIPEVASMSGESRHTCLWPPGCGLCNRVRKKKYCCASGFVAFLCLPVVVPRYGLFLLPCIFSLILYCKLFGVSGSVSKKLKTITNKQNHLSWNHAIDSCWRSDDLLTKKRQKKTCAYQNSILRDAGRFFTKILSIWSLPFWHGGTSPKCNLHFNQKPIQSAPSKCKLHLG